MLNLIFVVIVSLWIMASSLLAMKPLGHKRRHILISSPGYVPYIYVVTFMFGYAEQSSAVAILICVILVFFIYLFKKNILFPRNCIFLNIYCAFFALCFLGSVIFSSNAFYAFTMMCKIAIPIIMFLFTYIGFKSEESANTFFESIAHSTIVFFILALFGRYLNIETYLYYGMIAFPFAFVLLLKNRNVKSLIYCVLCFSFLLVYVKRTCLLGILAMILLAISFRYRFKGLILIMLTLVASVLVALYTPAINKRIFFDGFDMSGFRLSDLRIVFSGDFWLLINTNGRSDAWRDIYDVFFAKGKWFGSGPGSVKDWLTNLYSNDSFARVHNDWLQILCEDGYVGTTLLLCSFFSLIIFSYRTYKHSEATQIEHYVSLACAMSTVGTMIHMFFENCMGCAGFSVPFILGAVLFRLVRTVQHPKESGT